MTSSGTGRSIRAKRTSRRKSGKNVNAHGVSRGIHHVADFLIILEVHSDTTFYYGSTAETAHLTVLLTLL